MAELPTLGSDATRDWAESEGGQFPNRGFTSSLSTGLLYGVHENSPAEWCMTEFRVEAVLRRIHLRDTLLECALSSGSGTS